MNKVFKKSLECLASLVGGIAIAGSMNFIIDYGVTYCSLKEEKSYERLDGVRLAYSFIYMEESIFNYGGKLAAKQYLRNNRDLVRSLYALPVHFSFDLTDPRK